MKQKGFTPIILLIIIASFVAGVFVSKTYFTKQIVPNTASDSEDSLIDISTIAEPSNINDWVVFNIKTLGLKFRLPPNLAKEYGMIQEKEINGERGSETQITFNQSQDLIMTAQSLEYTRYLKQIAHGGEIADIFQGFKEEKGVYYGILPFGYLLDFPSESITQYRINGIDILKIKKLHKKQDMYPLNPPKIWAIINRTGNRNYSGVTIQGVLDQEMTEQVFEQILSTFSLYYPD